jgi:putative DNA primase/helicase
VNKLTDFNDLRDPSLIAACIAGAQPVGALEPPMLESATLTVQEAVHSASPATQPTMDARVNNAVQRLTALGPVEYDRVRKDEARKLDLRLATLDSLVVEARQKLCRAPAAQDGNGEELDAHMASDAAYMVGVPPDFIVSGEGVFWCGRSDRDEDGVRICAALRVTALVRDTDSGNWGRVLEFVDADDVPHKWVMPMPVLIGDGLELCRELAQQGLEIDTSARARALLVKYIAGCKPDARGRCVHKTGWYQNVFVLPDRTVGTGTENVLYQSEKAGKHYTQAGALDEWKCHVSRLCAGNSRLVLSVCAALAGPLLHFVGHDSGGVNFVGPSSIGKTTLLSVGASVFGGPGYIQTWRATGNGLEGLCELHNDTLLVLDEMGEVEAKEAGSIAYMIGNGAGKTRSDRKGDARVKKTWRLMFLSSGEVGLAQHMTEGGKAARAGQEVRLIDLPADAGAGHGVFEHLHDFENGGELSNALKAATRRYHGVAGLSFIEAVTNKVSDLPGHLNKAVSEFVGKFLPEGAGGQAARVCARFAIMAAAGEAATEYGVTDWEPGVANEAAAKCFQTWIDQRGGAGNGECDKILATVRAFFETHGDARFTDLTPGNERVTHNRAGFRKFSEGGEEYYVLSETYKREVCAGFDQRVVTKALIEAGWLQPGKDHKSSQKKYLPGLGEARVYVITPAIWRGNSID